MKKFRTLPRTYELERLAKYLRLLHIYPVPLIEIDTRKIDSRLDKRAITQDDFDAILSWKISKGIQSSEESEYRYLMRDLGLISSRPINWELEGVLPIGGDGPLMSKVVSTDGKMFFLTASGESLVDLYLENRPFYEDYLFWLVVRNKTYLPLIQQLICDPASYSSHQIEKLLLSNDSTSINSALSWGRYLGVFEKGEKGFLIVPRVLAVRLFSAFVLEIDNVCVGKETWYVKDIRKILESNLSLSSSAIDFTLAIDLLFSITDRTTAVGYSSSRADSSLTKHPGIQMIQFLKEIPLSVSREIDPSKVIGILTFVTTHA